MWEFENDSGGWFHPVHVHLVDFQILDRNGRPPEDFERGPKDVAYVGENELVRVLMKFEHEQGRFMMHCHNVVHEDHDMMSQFRVGEDTPDNDPFADRAAPLPARPLVLRRDPAPPPPAPDDAGGTPVATSTGGSAATPAPKTCAPAKRPPVKKKRPRAAVTKKAAAKRKPTVAPKRKPAPAACATPAKPKKKKVVTRRRAAARKRG